MDHAGKVIDNIKKLLKNGFFHIFFSQILNKIISFCNYVLIVRLVTKTEYGLYSYASNIISIFLLINGLGIISGLLQFGSESIENPGKLKAYANFAWKTGLLFSFVVSISILIYSQLADLKINHSSFLLILMSLFPVVDYVFTYIEILFRIQLMNKIYSAVTTVFNILSILATILGAYLFSIKGIVLFRYVAYIISIFFGLFFYRKLAFVKQISSYIISKNEKKSFLKLSFVSCLNNAISQMLYLLDVFVIGFIIPDEKIIASYKAATTIPFAMIFIPGTIMLYIYPYFAKNNKDREWVRANYYLVLKISAMLNAFLSAIMILFAPFIIRTLFGSQYVDSVEIFRILSAGYFIAATFRIPSGNILVTLRRIKLNFYNSVFSGIMNIILNIFFILNMGSIGAAYSTVLIYIISSIISTTYLNIIINSKNKPLVAEK